uniref:Uncharacterized protein n=1 Tax=Ditylenchus dipsaci TaxID=166011 RepID=A0A915D5M0_9BILA
MWWQQKNGKYWVVIDGGRERLNVVCVFFISSGQSVMGSEIQVDLNGTAANYYSGGQNSSVPCKLYLDEKSDGDGYLANVSLTGTPDCDSRLSSSTSNGRGASNRR